HRYLLGASYAFTDRNTMNSGVVGDNIPNLDNYFKSYGPTGARHLLNVSAMVDFPGNVQLSVISATSSRPAVIPYISNLHLDGDRTRTTAIPGLACNCFNPGSDKADLALGATPATPRYAG